MTNWPTYKLLDPIIAAHFGEAERRGGWHWRTCDGAYWAGPNPPPPGPLCAIPGHCLIHATTKDHEPWT